LSAIVAATDLNRRAQRQQRPRKQRKPITHPTPYFAPFAIFCKTKTPLINNFNEQKLTEGVSRLILPGANLE